MDRVQLSVKCVCVILGGVHNAFRLSPAACRRHLAITVDKYCDWLQQLTQEYLC